MVSGADSSGDVIGDEWIGGQWWVASRSGSVAGGLVCGRETMILRKHSVKRVGRDEWVKYFTLVLSVKYFTVGWPDFPHWLENILQLTVFYIKTNMVKCVKYFPENILL